MLRYLLKDVLERRKEILVHLREPNQLSSSVFPRHFRCSAEVRHPKDEPKSRFRWFIRLTQNHLRLSLHAKHTAYIPTPLGDRIPSNIISSIISFREFRFVRKGSLSGPFEGFNFSRRSYYYADGNNGKKDPKTEVKPLRMKLTTWC